MTTKNIYQRIIAIMEEVTYIQKGDKTVNNQYRFVSHDQVTAIIHPQLVKHGVVCIPSIVDVKQDGNRTEVDLKVRFVNADNPADFIESNWLGYGIDGGDKGPGKAVSYAFKYAILKTFCLETGDDPDNDQDAQHKKEEKSYKITATDISQMNEFLEKHAHVKKQMTTFITNYMNYYNCPFSMFKQAYADEDKLLKAFNIWMKKHSK